MTKRTSKPEPERRKPPAGKPDPARTDRGMSFTAAQAAIGVDRGTLTRWIKRGCPTVGGGGAGKAVQVDLREVW